VLSRFTPEQKPAINRAIEQAGDAALAFVESGIEAAMNQHN
jgi:peptidyl-tRNA hydrolase